MGGDELRRLRRKLGWTQEQLADAVGVAPNSVARWERDELGIRESAVRLIRRIVAEHAEHKPGRKEAKGMKRRTRESRKGGT